MNRVIFDKTNMLYSKISRDFGAERQKGGAAGCPSFLTGPAELIGPTVAPLQTTAEFGSKLERRMAWSPEAQLQQQHSTNLNSRKKFC